jgi:hypothetical protein
MPQQTHKKNQFFIITALQLINAVEYIYHTGKENDFNELILCTVSHKIKKEAESVLHLFKWSKVIDLVPEKFLKINNLLLRTAVINYSARRKLNKIFDPEADLIFGHERNVFCRYISKKGKHARQVLLDDGAGSIAFKHDHEVKHGGRLPVLTEKYFGVENHFVRPDLFFTAYRDKIDPSALGAVKLMDNSFAYLKKLAKDRKISNDVYFIGDPLVERNVISEEDYFRQIEEVKNIYGDNLFYVPRSTEDPEKVERIGKMVKIIRPGVPFEVFLVTREELPKVLVGYHTSVIFNTHRLFGDTIKMYHIKLKEFRREIYKEILPKIYKELDLISEEWSVPK